jgi:hypothetical protein
MIKVNKKQLRLNKFSEGIYGSFSLIKEDDALLLASIENEGILEPLVITKSNLVISGNRRLRVALCLTSINEVPVVYSDIQDDDLDEFVFIQFNQQRVKNVFQVAREFELIRNKFMVKQGVKDKERTQASKMSQDTLLENSNVSLSSVKRVLKAKRLKTELEIELNKNDNWNDHKSWEWIFQQGTIRKKEANSILKYVEEQIAEIKNYKISKSVSLIENDRIHLIHGDSSDLSNYLEDRQVDCIPNSPPYFGAI